MQPSCCCHAAMRATGPKWGGGRKRGGHPHRFPSCQCFACWPVGSGGRGRKQLSLRRGWSKCHHRHLAPHTTPPSLPPPANNTPRGVQSLRVGAKRISPPTPSAGHQGGGWGVTPPRPFTFRCFRGHVPVGSAVPPPSSSPPLRLLSSYRLCLQLLSIAPSHPPIPSTPHPLPALL